MSGPPDYSANPFIPQSQAGFIPAPDPGGLLSGVRQSEPFRQGILLSPQEQAALAAAPQRLPGTEVSVRATPVEALKGAADHMFVHYDDGQTQLIARGGPSEEGTSGYLSNLNRVIAEVTPEASSRDRGAPYRIVASRFLPDVSATQAAEGARVHALGVDHFGNPYGADYNSNSYAADVAQPILGYRPGDKKTWGYLDPLVDGDAPTTRGSTFTGPLNPDLTAVIHVPPY